MKKSKKVHFNFGCEHETKNVSTEITVSDYHPLTKREIRNLLRHAQQTGDSFVRNSIQIRLHQGIKGLVCPRETTGQIMQKENEVSELYLKSNYRGSANTLVNKLYKIMNF